MTIRYKCGECGASLNINDELAGTQGSCPRCQVEFVVPAPEVDGSGVSAEAVPAPAVEAQPRREAKAAGAPLSEDDIGDFLSSDGPDTATSGRRVSVADSDDEIPIGDSDQDDEPPSRGQKKRPENAFHDDDSDEDDSDKDDSAQRHRKQKGKPAGSGPVKTGSNESASIARNLMGRGTAADEAATEKSSKGEKKKGRPFGGREERREGQLTSAKEVVTYFAKKGWPAVAGIAVFAGLCVWISFSMMKYFVPALPLAPVTGTVTLDGKPLKLAIVKFVPLGKGDEGFKRAGTSFGFTDDNGKYTLTYANDEDKPVMGAVIGPHQVQIQLNDPAGALLIPPRYSTSKSELTADVAKGKPPIDFALKSDPPETTESSFSQ